MVLRSTLFALLQVVFTILFTLVAFASYPFSAHTRYRMITGYNRTVIWLARWVLGIRYVVRGREYLPAVPSVILSKHQSAWETVAFLCLFPPVAAVIKQELLDLPFFGWGFRMLSPIAIDRNAGRAALKKMLVEGREKLAQGFWVLVFPEGERMAAGKKGSYNLGGGWLAANTGVPVVPVAHNAGEVWGKDAFLKRPGTITISIGPIINSEGKNAAEIMREVEDWIETEMASLPRAVPVQ